MSNLTVTVGGVQYVAEQETGLCDGCAFYDPERGRCRLVDTDEFRSGSIQHSDCCDNKIIYTKVDAFQFVVIADQYKSWRGLIAQQKELW